MGLYSKKYSIIIFYNYRDHSIIQTEDGGYVVTWFTLSEDTGDRDVWVIKLDKDGNL